MSLIHRFIVANGVRHHVVEQGEGPLVLLLHGFPEGWYSWRHQIGALARAGYRVVAPDARGYGATQILEGVERFDTRAHVEDVKGLIDALGEPSAVVVGHDWGRSRRGSARFATLSAFARSPR
jgi:pimeloyl-ACP methyl ester carboxylesterase